MIYAVILAGGKGERFWPLSRIMSPKQFLNVTGSSTLIQDTIDRVCKIVPASQIYIITNKLYENEIRIQLNRLGADSVNILLEPYSRNTAPAIALISKIICEKDKNATLAVFPSDHFIKNEERFIKLIKNGINHTKDRMIVIFGVRPCKMHEGYGYIKVNSQLKKNRFYNVDKFIEKPNIQAIKRFMRNRDYFWNCGIFIFKPSFILDEFKKYAPKIYANLLKIKNDNLEYIWEKMPAISIDHGIIEKIDPSNIVMFDATNTGWSDVGSWAELSNLLAKDKDDNVIRADSIDIDSRNIIVYGKKRLIATIGLKDLIIIDTDDALLVCDINHCQKVKDIVNIIKKKCRHEHIVHKEMKFIKQNE